MVSMLFLFLLEAIAYGQYDGYGKLIVGFFRWWSAWLQHFLHQIEANASHCFIFGNRVVSQQIGVAQIAGQWVSVLICKPLVFRGVRMTGSDVFTLQMLQLTVYIVSIAHVVCWIQSSVVNNTEVILDLEPKDCSYRESQQIYVLAYSDARRVVKRLSHLTIKWTVAPPIKHSAICNSRISFELHYRFLCESKSCNFERISHLETSRFIWFIPKLDLFYSVESVYNIYSLNFFTSFFH